MKVLLLITMLCVCLQTRKLVFIQEVFRHGARYPINNHTWDNTQFAADQNLLGELTGEGKHMHYVLGKALYTRYWQALFANTSYENMYHQSQFYVRSTNVNRTL